MKCVTSKRNIKSVLAYSTAGTKWYFIKFNCLTKAIFAQEIKNLYRLIDHEKSIKSRHTHKIFCVLAMDKKQVLLESDSFQRLFSNSKKQNNNGTLKIFQKKIVTIVFARR